MRKAWEYFKTRKKLLAFLIIVAVGVAYFVFKGNGEELATATVRRGDIQEQLVLSGTLKAKEHVALRFPVSGKLNWVGVTKGEEVRKGQALVKLDTTTLFADLERAESDLRDKEAQLAVVYDAIKDHDTDESLSQRETRTTAEVAKDKAYRNVTKARYNLANATLTAPFDGFITYLASTFPGVNVLATEVQVEVINPETIYFKVLADQTEVVDLSVGQRVDVVLDSFSDSVIKGTIGRISFTPIAGEIGSMYEIEIVFENQSINLDQAKIGMTGDARFILAEKSDVLMVPAKFVNSDKKGKFVNLKRGNNKVYIEVGIEGEDNTEIIGEIAEGDTVFD